jgi:sigma-B regulation protein RsbU (phosphoserine phosphatase)
MSALQTTPATIEVRLGQAAGTRRELHERTLVGRSTSADLPLDHVSVSRKHAEFVPLPEGRWLLKDLGSRNGTSVNGDLISERVLRDGDQIAVGEMVLHFSQRTDSRIAADEEDAPGFTITSFDRAKSSRVSADHVAAIVAFGRALQDVESEADRLRRLLELAVTPELAGWWSYALRVTIEADGLELETLSPPAQSAVGASKTPHISRTVLRAAAQTNEPVIANDLARLPRFQAEMTISPDSSKFAAVACPLRSGGGTTDVLYVLLPPDRGTVEWLMLLTLAAEEFRHADAAWAARAAAGKRAALEREMSLARDIQSRTLPRKLITPGLDWAVRYDPCLTCAGDYVDVVQREDGTVLLLVGDTAGKGMQAALITSGLHSVFHTQGRSRAPLVEVVNAANRYLRTYLPDSSFVTFAAMQLNPQTGEAVCVNCGHPPMVAVDSAGKFHEIPGGENLPLGVDDAAMQAAEVSIAPDDWIVAYTDGLSEMRNAAGDMLGCDALHKQIVRLCSEVGACAAEQVAEAISIWLDAYRGGGSPEDDRTLLVAKRAAGT